MLGKTITFPIIARTSNGIIINSLLRAGQTGLNWTVSSGSVPTSDPQDSVCLSSLFSLFYQGGFDANNPRFSRLMTPSGQKTTDDPSLISLISQVFNINISQSNRLAGGHGSMESVKDL